MRMSFWMFLLLVLLIAGGYYGYTHWWSQQSRSHWVRGMHNAALQSDEELQEGKDAKTGVEDDSAAKAPVRDANGWVVK
jgi:hypothetical protein